MFGRKSTKLKKSPYVSRKRPFIDVMPELGAGPIWLCKEDDDVRMPIDASELPISRQLASDFDTWQRVMDKRMDGTNVDFHNLPDLPTNFKETGRELTHRLIAEIGDKYDIKYDQ